MTYRFDVFLSHASEDKDFVTLLHTKLSKTYRVWYDAERIKWGDKLDEKIKEGLDNSKYGIVILSDHYLAKHKKWTTWEFNQILKNDKVRPILHNIDLVDIAKKYPDAFQAIENIMAIPSSVGIENIIKQAKDAIGEDSLCSERGVNYTRLRDLLAAGNWKEADEETLAVMLKASGREKNGWLDTESIENFPCTDLRTIDQLWVKYSKGRFGFSVQKRIWESVGGTPDADYETYCKFGDKVGWRVKEKWINEQWKVIYNTTAPSGHLPNVWGFGVVRWKMFYGELEMRCVSSLASRLVKCNI